MQLVFVVYSYHDEHWIRRGQQGTQGFCETDSRLSFRGDVTSSYKERQR